MVTETIDHTTFTKLAEAGAVRSAHIVGHPGGWGILVKYGSTEGVLAAQHSQKARIFRSFETLVRYLKRLGIVRFDVDAANFAAESTSAGMPSDTTAALKNSNAAAYDKWLKAEVQDAIDDTSPSVSHEEAKQHFAAKREALRRRIAYDNP
jgi:hypothetical protein